MRSSIIFVLLFYSIVAHGAPREAKLPSEFDAQVIRVIDGDTFKFKASLLDVDINGTCRMNCYFTRKDLSIIAKR